MDYEVYPLAVTHVEWRIFIDVCQRVLGISPTRGIDACHLDPKDPAAFLGSLDMENKPIEALRDHYNPGHSHFSISFMLVSDDAGVKALRSTGLKMHAKDGLKRRVLTIVTGTMDEWFRAIICGCRSSASYELRWIMNLILTRFETAGFREVFSHLTKHNQSDETFVLKS